MATGRRSALLISNSVYEDLTFRQLQAPAADVNGLQNVLSNPAIGNYTVQLLNDTPSHQVNQAIERFFAEATLDDLVLLYFSGHGFKDDEGRLYLVTSDSRRQLLVGFQN
jgi:Caspase domain